METNISLDEVINYYLSAWELPDSQYGRISDLGIRGYRQIYMHATATPIEIPIEVLANKTSLLPCDCLSKIRIGVLNGQGEVSPLTEDGSIGFAGNSSPSRTSQQSVPILLNNDANIYYDPNGNYVAPFIFEIGRAHV